MARWLQFSSFTLDLDRLCLFGPSGQETLRPKSFDVLRYLVAHPRRVISKDELIKAVWPNVIVTDESLTRCISDVRHALGDASQQVIKTVPKRGYLLDLEVSVLDVATGAEPERIKACTPDDFFFPTEGPTVEVFPSTTISSDSQYANRIRQPSGPSESLAAPMLAVRPVVAVSPFVAVGDAAEEKTFARGLFENVITALNRFRRISVVVSWNPPRLFDGATDGVERTEGVNFAARYVVQGAVHRDGERLRVTARLVGSAGLLLWTDRFDGVLADGFDLQDRIAATVAGSIEPRVQAAEARRYSAAAESRNATPHELHLRAQPIFSKGIDNILQSLRLLERAIALDSSHAPSLADAAYCLQLLDINGWAEDRQQTRRRALEYARKALQISGDAEPIAAAALVFAYFGEEMDAALALGGQAATLNPYLARGLFSNGTARLYAGKLEEAAECFEASARLNPWDHAGRRSVAGLGILNLFEGRLDDAISRLRQAVHEYPRWATPYCTLASCYAYLGHEREAAAVARRLKAVDPSLSPTVDQFSDERHRELLGPGLKLMRA